MTQVGRGWPVSPGPPPQLWPKACSLRISDLRKAATWGVEESWGLPRQAGGRFCWYVFEVLPYGPQASLSSRKGQPPGSPAPPKAGVWDLSSGTSSLWASVSPAPKGDGVGGRGVALAELAVVGFRFWGSLQDPARPPQLNLFSHQELHPRSALGPIVSTLHVGTS